MKRIAIITFLFLVVIFMGILGLFHLRDVKNNLTDTSNQILQAIEADNKEDVLFYTEQLRNLWYEHKLFYYIRHDDLDKISVSISRINSYVTPSHYIELSAEIYLIKALMQDIWQHEYPSVTSIFG